MKINIVLEDAEDIMKELSFEGTPYPVLKQALELVLTEHERRHKEAEDAAVVRALQYASEYARTEHSLKYNHFIGEVVVPKETLRSRVGPNTAYGRRVVAVVAAGDSAFLRLNDGAYVPAGLFEICQHKRIAHGSDSDQLGRPGIWCQDCNFNVKLDSLTPYAVVVKP